MCCSSLWTMPTALRLFRGRRRGGVGVLSSVALFTEEWWLSGVLLSTVTSSILGAWRSGVDGGVPACCCFVVVCSGLCVNVSAEGLVASDFTGSKSVGSMVGSRLCGFASNTYSVFTATSTVLMVSVLASLLVLLLGGGMMGVLISTICTGSWSSSPGRSQ